jgi:hypothetical protein
MDKGKTREMEKINRGPTFGDFATVASMQDVTVARLKLKLTSQTNLARLGHFHPASQAGRLAGPVFYVYVFSLLQSTGVQTPLSPLF